MNANGYGGKTIRFDVVAVTASAGISVAISIVSVGSVVNSSDKLMIFSFREAGFCPPSIYVDLLSGWLREHGISNARCFGNNGLRRICQHNVRLVSLDRVTDTIPTAIDIRRSRCVSQLDSIPVECFVGFGNIVGSDSGYVAGEFLHTNGIRG